MYILSAQVNNSNIQKIYFYRKNKEGNPEIFTFNTPQTAQICLQMFSQFTIDRLVQQDPLFAIGQVMSFLGIWKPEELTDKEKETFTCGFVSFEKLMDEKNIKI